MPVTALTDGVWGVLATPFTADGSAVDHGALQRQVRHYREAGAAGLTVLGVFGEVASLTAAERQAAIAAVVEAAVGLPVVMGLPAQSTRSAMEQAAAAADTADGDGVLRFFGGEAWRSGGQQLPSAQPGTFVYTRREPVGVAAVITPWNFPVAIPARKCAPALASGNAVVLKPAEAIPVSAWHLADVGLPPGVFNVVYGDGTAAGRALAEDAWAAALSFTGSVPVGRELHDVVSKRRARVQLEMGGKNPLVVLDDADPAVAARIAAASGFALTGQACTATSRVICTPGIHMPSWTRWCRKRPDISRATGWPMACSWARSSTRRSWPRTGITSVSRPPKAGRSSPALASRPGCRRSPWSRRSSRTIASRRKKSSAQWWRSSPPVALQAGVVKVSRPTTGLDLNVPFGGVKDSSNIFREQGSTGVDFYTWTKSVYMGVD